jgi:site-specific recombinase XerD
MNLVPQQARPPANPPALTMPALIAAAGDQAALRFLEFFAAAIRNPHTRRAYARAVGNFLTWCEDHAVPSIAAVQPLHVAAWIELQTRERSAPTVKLRLAAIRHCSTGWSWTRSCRSTQPLGARAGAQRASGQDAGARPGRSQGAARQHRRRHPDRPARLGADRADDLQLRSYRRGAGDEGRGRLRPEPTALGAAAREGGKRHEMPCHHTLEEYLHAYLDGTGIADDPKGSLFRTIGRGTSRLTRTSLPPANAYAMVTRRALAAGFGTRIGNHSFRATGITAYLKNGGTLENAAAMANHASTRTTQLYDRRHDEMSLDEVERIWI